jgi:hypothetical protein
MNPASVEQITVDRTVAHFLLEYHSNWKTYFPGLNKRAHWHVLFSARMAGKEGVSCRTIHRALYGSYGTDIRTCIERLKDCERDGLVAVFDGADKPCAASAGCSVRATDRLYDSIDRHADDIAVALGSIRGQGVRRGAVAADAKIAAIFDFFRGYDQKWRATSEQIVRRKGLTPAHFNDAMDHLVTYQYWAIVMFLWRSGLSGDESSGQPALVIDEINSKMWDVLGLGHLAIKERVENLIRWGFFAEQTIKRHKAVALVPEAAAAITQGLADSEPLLDELHARLVPNNRELAAVRLA